MGCRKCFVCRYLARAVLAILSEAAGTRTPDLRIKSPLLYRLSYSLDKEIPVSATCLLFVTPWQERAYLRWLRNTRWVEPGQLIWVHSVYS